MYTAGGSFLNTLCICVGTLGEKVCFCFVLFLNKRSLIDLIFTVNSPIPSKRAKLARRRRRVLPSPPPSKNMTSVVLVLGEHPFTQITDADGTDPTVLLQQEALSEKYPPKLLLGPQCKSIKITWKEWLWGIIANHPWWRARWSI